MSGRRGALVTVGLVNCVSADVRSRGVNPIPLKELRESSRWRRTYLLRSVYVALLTVYVVLVWYKEVVPRLPSGQVSLHTGLAYQIAHMSEAGKAVAAAVAWFQFLGAQGVMLITCSGAIIREVRRRTFGMLMSSLLSHRQIVAGKLSAEMPQVLLLVLASVPLLMVVRVLGGVTWNYVLATTCVTICSAVFAGAMGIRQSATQPRLVWAVIVSMAQCGGLYLATGLVVYVLGASNLGPMIHFLPNPFVTMDLLKTNLLNPVAGNGIQSLWPAQCAVLLSLTICAVESCAGRIGVRKDILSWVPPPPPGKGQSMFVALVTKLMQRFADQFFPGLASMPKISRRYRIGNWPIAWKDSRFSLVASPTITAVLVGGALILLGEIYVMTAVAGLYRYGEFHGGLVAVLLVPGLFATTYSAAISIAKEREARCWTVLLTTAMSDWRLLMEKAWGAMRRGLPAWMFLAAHLAIFTCLGFVHPVVLVHLSALIIGQVLLLTSIGLYMSVRIRRPSLAMVATLAVPAMLWFVIPSLVPMIEHAAGVPADIGPTYWRPYLNPLSQAYLVTLTATGEFPTDPHYRWPEGNFGAWETTKIVMRMMCVQLLIGLLVSWRASRLFRQGAD